MLNRSDYFILLGVAISYVLTMYLWFALGETEQAIFTAIWVPSILSFGIYFKVTALLRRKMDDNTLLIMAIIIFGLK